MKPRLLIPLCAAAVLVLSLGACDDDDAPPKPEPVCAECPWTSCSSRSTRHGPGASPCASSRSSSALSSARRSGPAWTGARVEGTLRIAGPGISLPGVAFVIVPQP